METATQQIIERELPVGTEPKLTVSNVAGKISVRVGDDGCIFVRAAKNGPQAAMDNTVIDIVQDGDSVRIETRSEKRDGHFGFLSGHKMSAVDYEIVVPRTCSVATKGVSASVTVTGTNAPLSVETVSGSISVADVIGNCTISTVSGDVSTTSIDGELQVRTTSGNTEVLRSRLRSFNMHGVSGSFTVETPLARGSRYFAKTVSGDLHLAVPSATAATLHLKSVSGRTSVDFPAHVLKSGHRSWQGTINGGGATVECNSISGSIRVTPSSEMGEQFVASDDSSSSGGPTGAESSDTKLAILQKLEAGEINVEEALNRLKTSR